MVISVIDFGSPTAGPKIARSLHETGFAVLVNHPIPKALIRQVYDEWSAFFDSAAKFRYPYSPERQDGYFGRPEQQDPGCNAQIPSRDDKEFFHLFAWGQTPDEVSDAAVRYRALAEQLAKTVLSLIEANTPDRIKAMFPMPLHEMLRGSEKNTLLRIIRYPPTPDGSSDQALRAEEHSDINLLTLLAAATGPGLEVRDRVGTWHEVRSDFGNITINAGAMLDLVSRGYYHSGLHRVARPTGQYAARPRMAMPLFLHPADDVVLDGRRTAAELLAERLQQNYGQEQF